MKRITIKLLAILFLFFCVSIDCETEKEIVKIDIVKPPPEVIYITYPEPAEWIDHKLIAFIVKECDRQNVPYLLVFKQIEYESGWKINAKGINRYKGKIVSIDYGLMQLNSIYIPELIFKYGDKNKSYDVINNPYDNVELGIRYLASLYRSTGNWGLAVQSYNAGLVRVRTGKPPQSTIRYQEYVCPIEYWWEFPDTVEVIYN